MKRHRIWVFMWVCVILSAAWGAGASPGQDRISTSSPVWLPDGSSLLFLRQVVHVDPLGQEISPGSSHLFLVGADGRGLRPIGAGNTDSSAFQGDRVLVPSKAELWIMRAGRPESIQTLWDVPPGHLLCDARYDKSTADFLALTYSKGTFTLWVLDGRGSAVSSRAIQVGSRFSWSSDGRFLLVRGADGLWVADITGTAAPKRISAGSVTEFGFLDEPPGLAYFHSADGWYVAQPKAGENAIQPAGAGFDPKSHPVRPDTAPGALPGAITFVSPGPSGELLVSDGERLQSLSVATGRAQTLADIPSQGRSSWTPDGETIALSGGGKLFFYHTRTGKVETADSGQDPVFSPRGDQVAFWRQQAGSPRIIVRGFPNGREWLSAAGRQPVWLTYRDLACIAKQRDNWQVAMVSLKDGVPKPITALTVYTIQLAAFPTPAEAQAFANRLPAGFPAVCLQETDAKGKKWYRVRAGAFATAAQAETAFTQMQGQLKDHPGWNGSHMIAPAVNEFGWLWPTPDGAALVFEAMGTIYCYDFKKTALKTLWRPAALSLYAVRDVALSPDGQRIAFVDELGRLNVMPVSGGKPIVVCGAPEL